MSDLKIGEHDLLAWVKPDTLLGAIIYLALFALVAMLLARGVRSAVHAAMTRHDHIDRTTISFLQQITTAMIWVIMLILYAHLIPVLRSMGTALLAGASVASVVIGLAAQSTLGNLVAGVSITIYRPFRLGDTLQLAAPTGAEVGVVELISLGYTTLRTLDGRLIVVPNSIAASQVTINLDSTRSPSPVTICIRLSRDANLEAAQKLAVAVATEMAGEKAAAACYLTKVEAMAITIELRLSARDDADRAALRSRILAALAQRFAAAQIGSAGAETPVFS
jgi:small-conductance mechanosensitive channel